MTTTSHAPSTGRVQRRVLTVLCAAQIAGGIGVAVGFAIAALTAAQLSGTPAVGGLAATAATLGAAIIAVPTARAAARGGRRAGLTFAYACGSAGAVVCAIAVVIGFWPLLLTGLALFGGAVAANLNARYAATDLAPPERSARHLSLVIWATTIGSVTGPNLAAPAGRAGLPLGLPTAAGPFAFSAVVFLLATAVIFVFLRPDPLRLSRARRDAQAVPTKGGTWQVLRSSAPARKALGVIVVGHTAMVSIMSLTPVHMDHGGATLQVVGIVISLHIAGMYVLSPLVGWLADRFGRRPTVIAGMVLLFTAAVVAGTSPGDHTAQLAAGLVLLGLGWSCCIVAGSALLTESVPIDRRPGVQGTSDMLMQGGGAVGSLVAGGLIAAFSYGVLGATVAIMVAVTLTVTLRGWDDRGEQAPRSRVV